MASSPESLFHTEPYEGANPSRPLSAVPAFVEGQARRDDRWSDSFDPAAPARVKRDLAYASALLDAAERLRQPTDRPSLFSAIAEEAALIVEADDVAIVQYAGIRRRVLGVHVPRYVDDQTFLEAVHSAADQAWLSAPGSTPDLALVPWRSTLTVGLISPNRQDQTRLVWFSHSPRALDGQAALAALFGRHADLALQALAER